MSKDKDNRQTKTFLKIAYTPSELAAMLGVNSSRIRKWIKNGYIQANHVGRTWLIPQAEVKRLSGLNPPDLDAFIAWAHEGVILENTGVVQTYTPPAGGSPFNVPTGEGTQRKLEYKSDRLDYVLEQMCRHGRFYGAVLSDATGLVVAAYNSPFEIDSMAAYASVLSGMVAQAGRILELNDISRISMDISPVDKMVAPVFTVEDSMFILIVLCARETDETEVLESGISQVRHILAGSE